MFSLRALALLVLGSAGAICQQLTAEQVTGFNGAPRSFRLMPKQLQCFWAHGYRKVFICYSDGSEMVYTPDCEIGRLRAVHG